jgi:hypothetical protein
MMEAAQAVARRAAEEANLREHGHTSQQSEEPSEASLAALLLQAERQPQQLLADSIADQDEGMQWAIQMMAQQEQQRQHLATLAAIAARPQEHYISIAQNGEFACLPSDCSCSWMFLTFCIRF